MSNQAGILVADNVPLLGEEAKLSERWSAIFGAFKVSWEGRELPWLSLINLVRGPDRGIRERVWLAMREPVSAHYSELDSLFESLVRLRDQIAGNAGCESYSEYGRRMRNRIDFTLAQTDRMVETLLAAWLPLLAAWRKKEASRLGVDRLRPWDESAATSQTPLKPYETTGELISTIARVFRGVHPRLGDHFSVMGRSGLLDLDFRPHSPPVAINTRLHFTKRAHIFMSIPPGDQSVNVLAHEAGHSFHFLEAAGYPLHWQRLYNSMAAEFASTTMQLLVMDHLSRASGGFYSADEVRHSAVTRLREAVQNPVHWALSHAFERWAYEHPAADEAGRTAAWRRIWGRGREGEDWSGVERHFDAYRGNRGTIYTFPFYDFDYMVGQLGALQVWRNYLHDPRGAVDAYLDALRLGNTKTVPEIYATAGARIDLDPKSMGELAAFLGERLEELEAAL
jgi:oligoendopeptidase F